MSFITDSGGSFAMISGSQYGLSIDSAQRVSIGGTAAKNKLDVEGAVAIGWQYAGSYTAPSEGLIVQGNVGIGTDSPNCDLEINGGVRISNYHWPATGEGLELNYDPDINYGVIQVYDRDAGTFGDLFLGGGNVGIGQNTPTSLLHLKSTEPELTLQTSAGLATFKIKHNTEDKWSLGWNSGSGYLYFYDHVTPGGTRMVIRDSDGFIGIGDQTPDYRLDVNGDIGCITLHETSDKRLKSDIKPLSNVLDRLEYIRGISFAWNDEAEAVGAQPGEREIGVLADEVEKVFPELVDQKDDGYKSVDYSKLTAVLVEAVKELQAQNDELRARIERLENK
jgi:hypothetical protein